jgi:hypothetical protein
MGSLLVPLCKPVKLPARAVIIRRQARSPLAALVGWVEIGDHWLPLHEFETRKANGMDEVGGK